MKKQRQEFADTMLQIANIDPNLIVLVGDISHGILQPFAKKFPDKYFNIGICEPSMVNMAAGLNMIGYIPVIHTIAPFITERSYEQIKLDFGYQNLSVNIISVGASFDYSQLGCSHHCYTDVSLLSHFKRSSIFIPGSAEEFKLQFENNYNNGLINYFRLSEYDHEMRFSHSLFLDSKGIKVKNGNDVTIAVIGPQLKNAYKAAEILKSDYEIDVEILYFPTYKPFDAEILKESVKKTKILLTLEELSSSDGLYSLCLKNLVGFHFKAKQLAIDDFIHGYGSYNDLCESTGLNYINVINEVKKLLNK